MVADQMGITPVKRWSRKLSQGARTHLFVLSALPANSSFKAQLEGPASSSIAVVWAGLSVTLPAARTHIVEPNQIDILAFTVLRDL
jgi:hypothetical protein